MDERQLRETLNVAQMQVFLALMALGQSTLAHKYVAGEVSPGKVTEFLRTRVKPGVSLAGR